MDNAHTKMDRSTCNTKTRENQPCNGQPEGRTGNFKKTNNNAITLANSNTLNANHNQQRNKVELNKCNTLSNPDPSLGSQVVVSGNLPL